MNTLQKMMLINMLCQPEAKKEITGDYYQVTGVPNTPINVEGMILKAGYYDHAMGSFSFAHPDYKGVMSIGVKHLLEIKVGSLLNIRLDQLGEPKCCYTHGIRRLTGSIKEHGVITPIRIKPNLDICDGHCRVMAARRAGLTTIPAEIV